MDFSKIKINFNCILFFMNKKYKNLKDANDDLYNMSGIIDFFNNEKELDNLYYSINITNKNTVKSKELEYGDYQTNKVLTDSICNLIVKKKIEPEVLIEPTCGKGNFILSALNKINSLKNIVVIEIQEEYLWQLKFAVIDFYYENHFLNKPDIHIFNDNFFCFDFAKLYNYYSNKRVIILGNPPWVTNSELSSINSNNLPKKSNFNNLKGIDAITGKSNFDLGEFIIYKMIDNFSENDGYIALLLKNTVIKNILLNQKTRKNKIGNFEQYKINALKEFKVATEASLLFCKTNVTPCFTIKEMDFYTSEVISDYGWVENKFTSDINNYLKFKKYDGVCPFEWRQGIKHDCSKIMELEKISEGYINGLFEKFDIEEDLIFGILKSSDLKNEKINKTRKYTIITQMKVGQETKSLLDKLPKTKEYLYKNIEYFEKRKSNIYKSKPLFSIFGVGDYSFKPFKVAISGLYKQTKFSLIEPVDGKCLMLDDTCYFIGFDKYEEAVFTQYLLNRDEIQKFLKSIIFMDSKRVITKDVLMRIDINVLLNELLFSKFKFNFTTDKINNYLKILRA